MRRKGYKTLLNTSAKDELANLIDVYIKRQPTYGILTEKKGMSITDVIEEAFLYFLFKKGELEAVLKEGGYSEERIKVILSRLKNRHG